MVFIGFYSHFIHRKERDLAKEIPGRGFLGDERCKKFPRKCWKQIRLFGFYGYFMDSFSNENKIYMINNILDKKHLEIYILDITP